MNMELANIFAEYETIKEKHPNCKITIIGKPKSGTAYHKYPHTYEFSFKIEVCSSAFEMEKLLIADGKHEAKT